MNFWTADNVFDSWDLNPVAAATGIARDVLSLERDQFLQPLMAQYRAAAATGGFKAAEDDYSLFFDDAFRTFVQTGQLPHPGYVTPAAPSTLPASTVPVGQIAATGLAALGPQGTSDIRAASAAYNANPAAVSVGPSGVSVNPAALGASVGPGIVSSGGSSLMTWLVIGAMTVAVFILLRHRK